MIGNLIYLTYFFSVYGGRGVYKLHKIRVEVNFIRLSCLKSLLGVNGVIFRMSGWGKYEMMNLILSISDMSVVIIHLRRR